MLLKSHLLTEEDKRAICAWDYPGEYALYNLPPYEKLREKCTGFCDPDRAGEYLGFSEGEELIGFVRIRERETDVFIGVGVSPALCGRGYGQRMLRETVRIARDRCPGKMLSLQVRTWNERAIRCYEKAGFMKAGEAFEQETGAGNGIFYRMIHE